MAFKKLWRWITSLACWDFNNVVVEVTQEEIDEQLYIEN